MLPSMPTGTPARRRSAVLAIAAVLTLVLAACDDAPPKPATLPSNSVSSPQTTSPSSTTLTPEEEVEQFVRDYYAELNRAARTHDVSKLKTMSTKGCPCYKYVRNLRAAEKAGYVTPDIEWRIAKLTVRDVTNVDAVVGVLEELHPYDVLDSDGDVVRRFRLRRANLDYSLIKGANGWFIGNVIDLGGV